MHPQPSGLVAWRQPETPAEVKENVRGLGDDELAGFEERRREWRARDATAVDELQHRRQAALAAAARHVDIVGARLLQRQPDEFAAALDRWPVVELVAHHRDLQRDGRGQKTFHNAPSPGILAAPRICVYA